MKADPEPIQTPGRDAMQLWITTKGGVFTHQQALSMPDEWQARMAHLLNEMEVVLDGRRFFAELKKGARV